VDYPGVDSLEIFIWRRNSVWPGECGATWIKTGSWQHFRGIWRTRPP